MASPKGKSCRIYQLPNAIINLSLDKHTSSLHLNKPPPPQSTRLMPSAKANNTSSATLSHTQTQISILLKRFQRTFQPRLGGMASKAVVVAISRTGASMEASVAEADSEEA